MLPCVVFQIPKQNLKSSHLYILWCLLLLRYLEDCLFLTRIYCIPVPENTVGNVPKNTVQDFPIFTVFLIPVYNTVISVNFSINFCFSLLPVVEKRSNGKSYFTKILSFFLSRSV